MRLAGFSESSVNKNVSKVEKGEYYNFKVTEILNKTVHINVSLIDAIKEEVQREEFKKTYSTQEKVKILGIFVGIYQAILPNILE